MTVVVEAAERSGSLITAEFARTSAATSAPCRARSRPGARRAPTRCCATARPWSATPATSSTLLVGVEGEPGTTAARAGLDRPAGRHRAAGLEPRLADLLDAVEAGRDTVAALAGDPAEAAAIVAGLTELELLGLLRRAAGGRYVRAAAP